MAAACARPAFPASTQDPKYKGVPGYVLYPGIFYGWDAEGALFYAPADGFYTEQVNARLYEFIDHHRSGGWEIILKDLDGNDVGYSIV